MKKAYAIVQFISYKYHRLLTYLFGAPELEDSENYHEIIQEAFPNFYEKHMKS